MDKRQELFIVGWYNDPQTKARVKKEIDRVLNVFLPESYERIIFASKTNMILEHIVDQAITGYNWAA